MFLVLLHATPPRDHPELDEVGGAYVNGYVERDTADEAVAVVRAMVEQENWTITQIERVVPVTRESAIGEDGLEYYEQALIDKEVLVFHTYPVDDVEDEDEGPR